MGKYFRRPFSSMFFVGTLKEKWLESIRDPGWWLLVVIAFYMFVKIFGIVH